MDAACFPPASESAKNSSFVPLRQHAKSVGAVERAFGLEPSIMIDMARYLETTLSYKMLPTTISSPTFFLSSSFATGPVSSPLTKLWRRQVQPVLRMPASISFHITFAAERACLAITLGSGLRMPCSTSSKRSALSNAS
jgi:hypothetical protein